MPTRKPTNPFYLALVVVGVTFAVTACAYGVMTVRGLNPHHAQEGGLIGLMKQHGMVILVVELAILGTLTVSAIASDDYWTQKFERLERGDAERGDQV